MCVCVCVCVCLQCSLGTTLVSYHIAKKIHDIKFCDFVLKQTFHDLHAGIMRLYCDKLSRIRSNCKKCKILTSRKFPAIQYIILNMQIHIVFIYIYIVYLYTFMYTNHPNSVQHILYPHLHYAMCYVFYVVYVGSCVSFFSSCMF